MFRKFFDPESLYWKPFGYIGELVVLSLLWAVCSLPVVTLGAATAALYDCVWHNVRRGEGDLLGRFVSTFKREWKSAIPSTLLWGAVLSLTLWLSARSLAANGYAGSVDLFGMAFQILLLIPVGCSCWVFPLLSRFTLDFSALNRTAVVLALGSIARTLIMGLAVVMAVNLFLYMFTTVFFTPGLLALLFTLLLEPVFRKYTPGKAGTEENNTEK